MSVRIGIDVGGTFTDAVAVDNETFELIGSIKIPTTHKDPNGVATGIIQALQKILEDCQISNEDVIFIAHGTTQATNALLEGDVERVGVIGLGRGVEGLKVKSDTIIEDIELAPHKYLYSDSVYLSADAEKQAFQEAAELLHTKGIQVVVLSSAYSVDDPSDELRAAELLREQNLLCTCTHDITKLYGLKIRTRTAVINASILPKMLQTAIMTEESVIRSGIPAPLMIMRCDGGVMNVQEVKSRPILTMLSGPAAGVAGALMHERISEGIFLEVGGTSTDISCIHNGQVMVGYAQVGGHKTYVNSLDVRTVGIAGGSMIRISGSAITDVGPRSAHIAQLPYISFTPPEELHQLEVKTIRPLKDDFPDYAVLEDQVTGKRYALTLTCAANASGFVGNEYASGYVDSAKKAFSALSLHLGIPMDQLLEQVHTKAALKNAVVVEKLLEDYQLDRDQVVLVGGGGGCGAVVPYLAKHLNMRHKIANNAQVISPIGVALALVREEVERTVNNPTDNDIRSIRQEAHQAALKSGAAEGTIDITVEIDPKRSIIKAIATGASALRAGDRKKQQQTDAQLIALCADSMGVLAEKVSLPHKVEGFAAATTVKEKRRFFGLTVNRQYPLRLIDREGVIRVQLSNGVSVLSTAEQCVNTLDSLIYQLTEYTESGERIPEVFVCIGSRLINLSKLQNKEQVLSLLRIELQGEPMDRNVLMVLSGHPD